MCDTAAPSYSDRCPEPATATACCPATAARLVHANALTACDAIQVACILESAHPGPHESAPVPGRSWLGRRRWTTFRW